MGNSKYEKEGSLFMENQIEKKIDLNAPIRRVWRAISDYQEFGDWFHCKFKAPFAPGKVSLGEMTWPGFEGFKFEVVIDKIEPERLFSFTWHPYAIEPNIDYSKEEPTLVEFELEKITTGTRLTVIESGFEEIPQNRRAEAFRKN